MSNKIAVPFTKVKFVQALETLYEEVYSDSFNGSKFAEQTGLNRKTLNVWMKVTNETYPSADDLHKIASHFKPKVKEAADILLCLEGVTLALETMQPKVDAAFENRLKELLVELNDCLTDVKYHQDNNVPKGFKKLFTIIENRQTWPKLTKIVDNIFDTVSSWHIANCSYQKEIAREEILIIFEETKAEFIEALGIETAELFGEETIAKEIKKALERFDKDAVEYPLIKPLITVD